MRLAERKNQAAPAAGGGLGWAGRGGAAGGPPAAVPGQGGAQGTPQGAPPAPAVPPGEWRPWRFRMSNDVWGTPVVSSGRLYVTSFEVHALDVATGRRQFKTRDVAWTMAVSAGRIHGSDGPSLYALDAADGSELWRTGIDGSVYSLRADPGTAVTGTRGGGVQARTPRPGELRWERAGRRRSSRRPRRSRPCARGHGLLRTASGRLFALDADERREQWSYPIGEARHQPTRPVG